MNSGLSAVPDDFECALSAIDDGAEARPEIETVSLSECLVHDHFVGMGRIGHRARDA